MLASSYAKICLQFGFNAKPGKLWLCDMGLDQMKKLEQFKTPNSSSLFPNPYQIASDTLFYEYFRSELLGDQYRIHINVLITRKKGKIEVFLISA